MGLSVSRTARLLRYSPALTLGGAGVAGLVLTRRCDMACDYCSIRRTGSNPPAEREQSVESWKSAIDVLHRLNVRMVVLTGGEPVLYSGIVEIARYARKRMLVSLVSNGRFLLQKDGFARELLENIDLVSISADAFMEDTLEGFAVDELERAALILDEMKLNREMILTITNRNIEEIPERASFFMKCGWGIRFSLVHAGSWQSPFRGTGNGLAPRPEHLEILRKMVSSLEVLRRNGLPLLDSGEFLAGIPSFVAGDETMPCPAGLKTMELDEDCTVQACQDTPSSGVRVEELLSMKDPEEFLRRTRLRDCRCHYSHYYRVASKGKLRYAAARFFSLLSGKGADTPDKNQKSS